MTPANALVFFCAISFLGYGFSCIGTKRMVAEFERYGLSKYRVLTGVLQVLAAVGLLVGLKISWIGSLAAAGLALQMACGLGVRIHLGDAWLLCMPAATYMIICGALALYHF